jgi:hypothetical protein
MLVVGAALGWLGWRVVEGALLVQRSQPQERLERATDHIVVALQRELADFDRLAIMAPGLASATLPEGVVVSRSC